MIDQTILDEEKRMMLVALESNKGWQIIVTDLQEQIEKLQDEINEIDPERTLEQENVLKVTMKVYKEMITKPQDLASWLEKVEDSSSDNDPYDK